MEEVKELTMQERKDKIAALEAEVTDFIYNNQDLAVTTPEEFAEAGEQLKIVRIRLKQIEEKRFAITKPMDAAKTGVMDMFKQLTRPLEAYAKELDTKMLTFHKQEQARIAAEQAKVEAEALRNMQENHIAEMQVPVLQDETKKVRTDFATISVREKWNFSVVDEELVPREYFTLDPVKVRSALRDGTRKIPGLDIFDEGRIGTR